MEKFSLFVGLVVDWIREKWSVILYSVAGVFLCLFLGFQWMGKFRGNAQADYVLANTAYHQWKSTLPQGSDEETWNKLEKPIARHPELKGKFDALIAQRLLEQKRMEQASLYASTPLARLEKESPYHARFAKASLLIGQGKLGQALEESKELKKSMLTDETLWEKKDRIIRTGASLFAYNLLRIAMLEKEAGTPEGEFLAWNEFEKNQSSGKTYDPEAYHLLAQNFRDQEVSLNDYIRHRLGKLKAQ